MGSKEGAWLADAKIAAGIDTLNNTHPLNCDIFGTLNVNATLTSGSLTIGTVNQGIGGISPWLISGSISVLNFPATQPVSGTVAVTQSTNPWVVNGSGFVQPVTRVGATMNTNQVTVGSTSTLILAANTNRKRLILINMGTTNVFLGNVGVTIGTGQLLLGIAGYVIPLYFTGAVYGIVGTGTQTIAYLEEAV